MPHDRDVLEAAERPLGLLEGRGRDVDQVDRDRPAAAAQRLGEHRDLLATAAPQLDERQRITQRRDDLVGPPGEEPPLRPRDPVPGKPADRLEKAGAERVIQVLRLELPRTQHQIPFHV